jgi:putative ABC transport system permease protein
MEILRNMWRRKFRTFLTIIGIAVGIFAFTVMGSMALKLNKMIDGGKKYITGQITITPKGSLEGSMGLIPQKTLDAIAKVDGVQAVEGQVSMMVDEPDPDNPSISFSQPPTIYSVNPSSTFRNRNFESLAMKEGSYLSTASAVNDIVIGINISLDKNWHVGDKVTIRGKEFNVIGIVDKTMTGPDDYVFMNTTIARELYVDSVPFLKTMKEQSDEAAKLTDAQLSALPAATRASLTSAKAFKMEDVSTGAAASWADGQDSEAVADRIKNQFKDDVSVLSPVKMGEQIDKASATFNAIILGSALLALIVGLFSIVNTMIMSISERTKEIGIKKAIGASNRSIAAEYTIEAGIIGLVGGAIGLGLGVLTAVLINHKMAAKGAEIFLLQGSFLIEVIVFSLVVGMIAGFVPALRASKLKIVEAIREL